MKLQYLLVWLLLLFSAERALAQATLVKEIYPLATGSIDASIKGVPIGNKFLFAADNSVNGKELWISDGTDAGTVMLKDIKPGTRTTSSNPQSFFTFQGIAYFYINLGGFYTPYELWRSDGTADGTYKIGDEETVSNELEIADNTLYFISDNGLIQKDLTKAGYKTIIDRSYNSDLNNFPAKAANITRQNGNWLFMAQSVQNKYKQALFQSDGTKAGTRKVANLGDNDGKITATKSGKLAFFGNDDGTYGAELWVTDGTAGGTKMVKNIAPGGLSSFISLAYYSLNFYQIQPLQDKVLFVADDGTTGNELWISDGTEAGTKLFKEFTAGKNGTTFYFYNPSDVGTDLIYFAVNNKELWRSDGTEAGTYMLATDPNGEFNYVRKLGDYIYYRDGDGRKVYRLDGRPASSQVVGTLTNSLYGYYSGPGDFLIAGNNMFYSGNQDATGWELWKLPFCDHQATISAPVGASFCTGASIDLQAGGSGGAGPFTYKWTSGTDNLGTNAKLTVNKTATYTVDVTDSRGCTISTSVQATETKNLPIGISGSTAYCAGDAVPLSGTAAGGTAPYVYQWFQNSSRITGQTATTLTVNTTGTYSLSVSDSKGCTGTSTGLFVSQKPSPSATISTNGTTVVQPGSSLSVVMTTPAASGQTYQWFRDGVAIPGATNNNYLATQAGGYTVQVNRDGCTATSSLTRLAVGLAVNLVGSPTFCVGGSTSLTVTPTTGDAPYTYQWRLGNTTVGTSSTITVSTAGSYSVTITDSKGVTGTLPAIDVTQRPVPTATISAGGPLVLQPGASVVLSAPVLAGQTYVWLRNGTAIAGATGATYTANLAGDYTVTVTRDACSATSVPTRVSLALQAAITGATQLCSGQSVTLVAGNTNGEGPFTYQWRQNGTVLNVLGNTLIVNTGGDYAVTITDSKGLIGVSPVFSVSQKPSPNATIAATGQLPLQPGTSAILSVVAVPTQTYQWFLDGQAITGATGSSYTVTQGGSYAVLVTRDGCATNSGGYVVGLILATEPIVAGLTLEASPNPTSHLLRVRLMLDEPAPATLRLFNTMGRQIQTHSFSQPQQTHEHQFDVGNVPAGMLLLRAEVGHKQLTRKLLKE
ncbi:T9SS type A sorting domain-containing protein [Fibrella aquatilis]|uniref:T9SS type A sorting domain-containing protein n=1 Tax=Fibrella aquatilis TaxID=2817059 RepID=A0A939GA69_9BACT|nr:T9SS type A sorting domain-containing protein [Fibrella aquatilis]MBO0933830.1 T9SS type A sorting domain-containing protein [Fibrella aquatilis]